ncbi:HlyD family efflux transporter periplasmic adaptor subunit, partial [Planctomycetota bacterium]
REVSQLTPNNMFKKETTISSGIEEEIKSLVSRALQSNDSKTLYLAKSSMSRPSSDLPLTDFTIRRIVPKGTNVNQGDWLVEFDSQPLYDAIEQAEEELETLKDDYEVKLDAFRTKRETLAIQVDKARLNLEQTLKDYNRLWEETAAGKISEDSLEFKQRLLQAKQQRIQLDEQESRYRIVDIIIDKFDKDPSEVIKEHQVVKQQKPLELDKTGIETSGISMEEIRSIVKKISQSGAHVTTHVQSMPVPEGIVMGGDKSVPGPSLTKSSVYYPEGLKNERPEIVSQYLNPLVNQLKTIEDKQHRLNQFKGYPQPLALYAPISGYVFHGAHNQERWSVSEDDIKEGARVNLTKPVVFVSNSLEMKVTINVGENDIGKLKPGQSARIRPNAYSGLILEGKVVEVSEVPMQQQGWRRHLARATGAKEQYSVVIHLLKSDPRLRPRMNAEVDIFCETHENILFVPQEAVFKKDDRKICYVWLDNEPEERSIKTGKSNTNFVIITEGLQAGDKVYLYNPFLNK